MNPVLVLVGLAVIFFIPGLIWTYVFFGPGEQFGIKTESVFLQYLERFVLAVALSLVLIPFSAFFLNIFISIGSNLSDAILITVFPIVLGILLYLAKRQGLLHRFAEMINTE